MRIWVLFSALYLNRKNFKEKEGEEPGGGLSARSGIKNFSSIKGENLLHF